MAVQAAQHEDSAVGVSEWPGRPSEEERASWQLQRQRREKLSNLMGQYLLKGYRMLGTTCSDCGNILLQTRQGSNYCVQCAEIIQEGASQQQQQQQQQQTTPQITLTKISDSQCSVQNTPKAPEATELAPVDKQSGVPTEHNRSGPSLVGREVCVGLEENLVAKLHWASGQLSANSSVEESTHLCQLIKACAEALKSVRGLGSETYREMMKALQ